MNAEHAQNGGNQRYEAASDAELVRGMRAADAHAFAEFIVRFKDVLLEVAASLRIDRPERQHLVLEVLDDVAMDLVAPKAVLPVSLAGYLVRALRHRVLNARREASRRLVHETDAMTDMDSGLERTAQTLCSEASIRDARGDQAEAASLPEGVRKLAVLLDNALSSDERLMLGWVSNLVPHRTIADWLGIGRSAAMLRIWRLRNRLRETALRFAEEFDDAEQRDVMRFLGRCTGESPHSVRKARNQKEDNYESR